MDLGLSEADFSRLSVFGLSLLMDRKRKQMGTENDESPQFTPDQIPARYEKLFGR